LSGLALHKNAKALYVHLLIQLAARSSLTALKSTRSNWTGG
jgi:hypothetical protein